MSHYSAYVNSAARIAAARFRASVGNSLGITLVETLIALAIFASAGTAVVLGVGTAHKSSDVVNASAVAEYLARNQMEHVWTQPYLAPGLTYTSIVDVPSLNIDIPSGFGVSAAAQVFVADDGLPGSVEKVVVTVTRDGQSILLLETLRGGP